MEVEYRAFIVGNSTYSHSEEFPTIKYAVQDAERIFDLLTASESSIFAQERSRYIADVTSSELDSELRSFVEDIEHDRVVLLIYYAGHAMAKQGELYLATTDTNQKRLETTSYWIGKLTPLLKRVGGRYIIALDRCQAGTALQSPSIRSRGIIDADKNLQELSGRGKIVVASSHEYQLAHELEHLKHGLFSYYFIEGIEDSLGRRPRREQYIGIRELFEYVVDRINKQHPDIMQVPVWSGEEMSGKLYIARNRFYKTPIVEPLYELLMIDDDADHIRQVQEYLDEGIFRT